MCAYVTRWCWDLIIVTRYGDEISALPRNIGIYMIVFEQNCNNLKMAAIGRNISYFFAIKHHHKTYYHSCVSWLKFTSPLVFLHTTGMTHLRITLPVCTMCVTFNGKFADDVGRDDVGGIASRSGSRFEPHWRTRFFAPFQTGPVAHTASCTMYWVHFPGIQRPERGVEYWPPSCAKNKDFYIPLLPLCTLLASYDIKVDLKRIRVWGREVDASGSR